MTCGRLSLTHNFYGAQLYVDTVDKVLWVNTCHSRKKKKKKKRRAESQGAHKHSRRQFWGWLNILEQE